MKRFFKNCKGAVTVMVTLLLIPAVLVSGTGVDIARIYAAKSTIQDANQLAANSSLASYDALLQDLYGIFGMMTEEEDFDGMVNKYVGTALGEEQKNAEIGTFNLFYGSRVETGITPVKGKNLKNQEVLLRQIEEYSKFRAPVIVAELLMDKLDTFEKVQEDAKVIKTKMEVDDGVEELEKCFEEIYKKVVEVDKCRNREIIIMDEVSTVGKEIQALFGEMSEIKGDYLEAVEEYEEAKWWYEALSNSSDPEAAADAAEYYETMQELEETMKELKEQYSEKCAMISVLSDDLDKNCQKYGEELETYMRGLRELLAKCEKAENKKRELKSKIDSMKTILNEGNCSDELKRGLKEPETDANGNIIDGKSVIDRYEALLEYNIGDMGQAMYDANMSQIEKTITNMKEAELGGYTLIKLKNIDIASQFPIEGEGDYFSGILSDSAEYPPDGGRDGTGFLKFKDINNECKEFYEELVIIYSQEEGNGADEDILTASVTKIFAKAQKLFKDLFFEPEGAKYFSQAENSTDSGTGTDFGSSGDWSKEDEGEASVKKALDDDFLGKLAKAAGEAGNKVLLMVYDTEMFSDASTPGSDEEGFPKLNMAGIPLSTDVNYYFQSELEYLYNGNLGDAQSNIRSVAGMIFLVRFVFNYIASFTVKEVKGIVSAVKAALAWTGPFAILAGETARLALALGESTMDLARLRGGEQVAIFKNDKTWKLSISGLTRAAMEEVSDEAINSAFDIDKNSGDDVGVATLGYTDYIRMFLLLVSNMDLAQRTANLIELNMTNKTNGINANEEAMASAELFDLSKAVTDIGITTTVDLRMLFLSMPFAQNAIDGVVPPKTVPITVTDYRGY